MGHYVYHGIEFSKRLSADEQRSVAMLVRNRSWGRKIAGTSVKEAVVPVAEAPKLRLVSPVKAAPVKRTTRKAKGWEKVKADWDANREAGTYTCRCGHAPFAALGSPEKGGALFHKNWTTISGLYGKARSNKHFIPAIG